jgi:hypothetical protein
LNRASLTKSEIIVMLSFKYFGSATPISFLTLSILLWNKI